MIDAIYLNSKTNLIVWLVVLKTIVLQRLLLPFKYFNIKENWIIKTRYNSICINILPNGRRRFLRSLKTYQSLVQLISSWNTNGHSGVVYLCFFIHPLARKISTWRYWYLTNSQARLDREINPRKIENWKVYFES